MNLLPREAELIRVIREEWRFGRIEIVVKDGIPLEVLKTVERKSLSIGH
jgi:hypothetical protein